jgi:nicotinamide-nucleotide amidase
MMDSFLLGHVQQLFCSTLVIMNRTLKVFGLRESIIQEQLTEALPQSSIVSLGYYPQYPEVSLKITGKGHNADEVQREIELFRAILYDRIGEYIYADTDTPLEDVVAGLLRAHQATLAVAESCTGGLIAHRLTNIAGSSQYLERGLVVYSNRAKEELLGVPPALLQQHGAVSEPAARHMAEAVRRLAGTTFGLAVTGIAGPEGGSPEKPVGTVFIGVATPAQTFVSRYLLHGSRRQIKLMSAHAALNLLRQEILACPGTHVPG